MEVAAARHDAEEAGLIYVTDDVPGIRRERKRGKFRYFGPDGRAITDPKVLARIRSLAIPPAYRKVWICPRANGHLQATGRDAKGRKQYRYHPRFRQTRDASKFHRMLAFAQALPRIRSRVHQDLSRRGLPKERVLAVIVYVLEKSLIRIGNDVYAKTNESFGLTTLRTDHVEVQGNELAFHFVGKSHVDHEIHLHDRRLARLVSKLQELPGQELFEYVGEDGEPHRVTSSDVNTYLREISESDFTAKDFRTWAATLMAIEEFSQCERPASQKQTRQTVSAVVRRVSKRLGNTPTVCRNCYLHPAVISAFESGLLPSGQDPVTVLLDLIAK